VTSRGDYAQIAEAVAGDGVLTFAERSIQRAKNNGRAGRDEKAVSSEKEIVRLERRCRRKDCNDENCERFFQAESG